MSRRYFLTLVGGADRRSPVRRHVERQTHPLRTLGNMLFLGAALTLTYGLGVLGLLVYSSVIEF